MKTSYLTAGITLKRLTRLVKRNNVSIRPRYLLKLIFLFQSALWSTIFALIEKKRFQKRIENTQLPASPVFIIGHWRTGSTLLHKLMSLDPAFTAPTLFQVAEPDSFLTSYPYYKPVMNAMLSKHRPMDNVRIGMNEPQEDEYAIYRITDHSPLESFVFPKKKEYFLKETSSFLPETERIDEWKKDLIYFYKKITLNSGKPFVSKNPFNSLRIKLLLSIFPDAKFIHIVRNPYDVVPSTIHMWNIVQHQNALNRNGCIHCIEDISAAMGKILETIETDKALIPAGNFAVVHFEALDKDPAGEMNKLYGQLNLNFTNEFRKKILNYLSVIIDFEKNRFNLSEEEKKIIYDKLEKYFIQYGYSR